MSQEMDISWQVLRRIAHECWGESAELAEVRPLNGGCISSTVSLGFVDGRKAVCKISPHRVDRSYVNEAHQLKLISELGLPTPRVYAAKIGSLDDPFSYILMDFVEGINLHRARQICSADEYDQIQIKLAEMMLAMHERAGEHYSRAEIEPEPRPFNSWPVFYREVFDSICSEALHLSTLPVKYRKQIGKIHDRLERLLAHDDVPRLVHWDIWSTNILVNKAENGNWKIAALLDPCCKFAHFEAEIAYMTLFQTSTPVFMKAYQSRRKLSTDYHKVRKPIYQLYFLLNHLLLFGSEYARGVMAAVDRLAGVV
jgi:fructosamine-3-kinase